MKFVSYNIQFGRGADGINDLSRIAEELRGADVIALQEVERYWQRSNDVDQPAALAALLPGYYWCYGAGVDLPARAARGFGPECRRQFGNMLLARTPIAWVRHHLLPKYASTGPMSLQRSALEGVIRTDDGPLRIYSVHLTHLSSETRVPQVARLLDIHANAVREGEPIAAGGLGSEWVDDGLPPAMPRDAIMLGDFNMESDSAEYRAMAGPLSGFGGRIVNPDGFVDAWVEAGGRPEDGTTSTIKGRPARLDYCFMSTRLRTRLTSVRVDDAATGSDHLPLWVDTTLELTSA